MTTKPINPKSRPSLFNLLLQPTTIKTPAPQFEPAMRRLKAAKNSRNQQRLSESDEIQLLDQWIQSQIPDSGTNPLAIRPPPPEAPVGKKQGGGFSPYAGCKLFRHLPISRKTKEGLHPKYKEMSEIQRASLPHSLCGRDILGAAKTGSGKTLAFIIPVVEKLYRARWGPEDGVGSIIISPTKELAGQLFEELKIVGKNHTFSAGLLIGGRKDVDAEKDSVSSLNILICTPGRLLQHMNETPNFECSQLQVLVLDEADRMLDRKFKGELDAIISQLPKRRQTLLFSATQTKSVKDLARLSLKDPEYISVHAESTTATPEQLKQVAMEVALDQKLNMLWSFIKTHLRSKMIVFLSTCKQVKFVYEAFRKLRPGIPLKCLHGNMKQNTRMAVYLDFCETTSVLFSTDVASRGLDFPSVDWVIQVDCPEDVAAYIHRVGRTARFTSEGNSLLFLAPSEKAMLTKLHAAEPKIPIILKKVKVEKIEQISGALASVLVKYPDMQQLAIRAFITYVRSINHQKDKDVFDVSKLPLEEYSASLGLLMTPKINSKSQKLKNRKELVDEQKIKMKVVDEDDDDEMLFYVKQIPNGNNGNDKAEEEDDILRPMNSLMERGPSELAVLPPIISKKKKKLKIIVDRPVSNKVKYDDDGNPIAGFSFATESPDTCLEPEKVMERYKKMMVEVKQRDKEDKLVQRQRLREKRTKKKNKLKGLRDEDESDGNDDDLSESERRKGGAKNTKIRFESDEEENGRKMKKVKGLDADAISLAEQEALALKLLSSMH